MAINIFCLECKTSNALTAKTCSKCGAVFTRDKKYRVCVSVKGQRITRLCDNLTIARETETAIKTDMLRDEFDITHHKAKKVVTLGDVWAKFLPWAKENKKTWKCDEYNYKTHLEPCFGNKALDAVTSLDVERLKLELKRGTNKQGRPFTQATIKHQLVLLNRLYNLAKRWGLYTGENPMDRVEMPRLDNQVTEFLDDDQLARLMATLDAWHCQDTVNFIKFALLTGLRRGELFKLTWDDIDFQRGLLTLRQPKGGKSEIIPISNEAMNVLRRQDASAMYIFPGKGGEQRTDFKGPWQRIRKAAGLPDNFRFHGLRHHFASTLISNGVDLAVVRGLLTHKDARTSLRYAHLQPDAMKQAALQSGKLLQPKGKQAKKVASIGKGKASEQRGH